MKQNFSKQEVDYTQVKNAVLENKKLSLKAKGLFAYLYSKPNNWDFSHKRIAIENKESPGTIAKILRELEEHGYLQRKRLSTGRMNYFITYEPHTKKPHTKKAKVAKSQGGKVDTISNIEVNSNTKVNNNIDIAKTSFAVEPIKNLLEDKQKHIQIIGLYAKAKKIEFKNKEQQQSFIKRNLRPAKLLIGYETEKIIETLKYLIKEADFKWTLETVSKYIDEDLKELNKKIKTDEEIVRDIINN